MVDPREELVEHIGAMRAFAISLCGNGATADDIVQDALIKAWSNIDSFQEGTNMRAWLFTIVRNTYFSLHRKRKREVEDVDGAMAESLSQKPDHDGRLALKDFAVAFGQLTDEQREALVLVGAQGFSYEEAAEMCGVALGTIKSRVNRGRAQLAELMDLEDDEPIELTDAVTAAIVQTQPAA
ncbi:RNA polymerase sigma factor [Ruegeria sp. HKCCD6428]|uniref:RNA polymerase sigma factor n=1 Tax=Ruegeria sp. HKCCD6428 TaxID=2683002 RepID=UPI001491E587|nr:RNA polymerase sigma factor [Ruegeria sp. HKCCD6428]NOC84582.1 RNA polymerase sigma factor [Ruegeria sp. HKCCD6428]